MPCRHFSNKSLSGETGNIPSGVGHGFTKARGQSFAGLWEETERTEQLSARVC